MAPSLSPTGFWCNASPKRVLSAPRSRGDGDTARPEAAPLPLKHPNRDHLQGGRLLIPLRRVGRHDDRAQAAIHPRAVQRAPLRSRGLSSPEVRHVAIGDGEATHASLAPGPEPCSLIAPVAPVDYRGM